MNKKYSKALFRLFEEGLRSRWPEFKKSKKKVDLGRAFVWSVPDAGNVLLFLRLDPKGKERYFCDFGWARLAEYPQDDWFEYDFPHLDPKSAFEESEMVAGIECLWGDNGTGAWQIPDPVESFNPLDYASNPEAAGHEFVRRVNQQAAMTEEDAERLVRPVGDDLFKRLEADVMPYLLEYIEFARASPRSAG